MGYMRRSRLIFYLSFLSAILVLRGECKGAHGSVGGSGWRSVRGMSNGSCFYIWTEIFGTGCFFGLRHLGKGGVRFVFCF